MVDLNVPSLVTTVVCADGKFYALGYNGGLEIDSSNLQMVELPTSVQMLL